ncbi:uncharacterized protein LOC127851071 [Dreissena polymorpha]|uniref:ZP domain-containing protein n=1 Tax=Dreissena polymorpha TaxID=45954 RepID=A0A9D4I2N2_DREPO|nr:uncharacterized protein LOC127851071 [Dreissena polymorpha]KAH3740201.1 hypothetical protein DPMN_046899 [Dreissena polymorpha]
MFRCLLFAALVSVTLASVNFSCGANGDITVVDVPPTKQYGFAIETSSSKQCTYSFNSPTNSAIISGCDKDQQILLTLSSYNNMTANGMQAAVYPDSGSAEIITYVITCQEIPASGITKTLNHTLAPALVTDGPRTFSPAIAIDAALGRYTANVGDLVDWILTIPVQYIATVESCVAEAVGNSSKTVTLMTNNCAVPPALMKPFSASYDPTATATTHTYTTKLTAFQFYGHNQVLISCRVKVCPSSAGDLCKARCPGASRRRRDAQSTALSTKDADSSDGTFLYQTRNVLFVNDPFTLSAASLSLPSLFAIAFALFAAL